MPLFIVIKVDVQPAEAEEDGQQSFVMRSSCEWSDQMPRDAVVGILEATVNELQRQGDGEEGEQPKRPSGLLVPTGASSLKDIERFTRKDQVT